MIPAILFGYAVGSLPIGYLVAQGASGIDLRRVGSGNVGATNVYRAAGLATAIAVMLADIGKGAAAVLLAGGGAERGRRRRCGRHRSHLSGVVEVPRRQGRGDRERRLRACSHRFRRCSPPRLRGGRCATRFVSLGSVVATIVLPIVEWMTPGLRAVDIGATVVAVLILFRHRGNVRALAVADGTRASTDAQALRRTGGT